MESWTAQFVSLTDTTTGTDFADNAPPVVKLLMPGHRNRVVAANVPLQGRLICSYSPPNGQSVVSVQRDVSFQVPVGASISVGMTRDPFRRYACSPLYNIVSATGEKLHSEFEVVQTAGHGIDTRPVSQRN
jgi:hypothetical protein